MSMEDEKNNIQALTDALQEAEATSSDNATVKTGDLVTRDGEVITTNKGVERHTG